MAGSGRLQAIERLGRDRHGGIKTDGNLGQAKVVIDGFRNADQLHPALLAQLAQDREAAITANANDRIQFQLLDAVDDFL